MPVTGIKRTMEVHLCKKDMEAKTPTGAYEIPAMLDLTCTRLIKIQDGVAYLGTGWSASPPQGYYLEIHPRSSIAKTGWMLANSTGIIDPDYRGELIVAIVPTIRMILEGYRDLESYVKATIRFPCSIVQLCLRPYIPIRITEVPSLNPTERMDGAFGSSSLYPPVNGSTGDS